MKWCVVPIETISSGQDIGQITRHRLEVMDLRQDTLPSISGTSQPTILKVEATMYVSS